MANVGLERFKALRKAQWDAAGAPHVDSSGGKSSSSGGKGSWSGTELPPWEAGSQEQEAAKNGGTPWQAAADRKGAESSARGTSYGQGVGSNKDNPATQKPQEKKKPEGPTDEEIAARMLQNATNPYQLDDTDVEDLLKPPGIDPSTGLPFNNQNTSGATHPENATRTEPTKVNREATSSSQDGRGWSPEYAVQQEMDAESYWALDGTDRAAVNANTLLLTALNKDKQLKVSLDKDASGTLSESEIGKDIAGGMATYRKEYDVVFGEQQHGEERDYEYSPNVLAAMKALNIQSDSGNIEDVAEANLLTSAERKAGAHKKPEASWETREAWLTKLTDHQGQLQNALLQGSAEIDGFRQVLDLDQMDQPDIDILVDGLKGNLGAGPMYDKDGSFSSTFKLAGLTKPEDKDRLTGMSATIDDMVKYYTANQEEQFEILQQTQGKGSYGAAGLELLASDLNVVGPWLQAGGYDSKEWMQMLEQKGVLKSRSATSKTKDEDAAAAPGDPSTAYVSTAGNNGG